MAENSKLSFRKLRRDLGLEHRNGVVERKNRTLVEMARTMLDEHRTPRRFWAEAMNTACYIANRIFLRAFLGPRMNFGLVGGPASSISERLAAGALCLRRRGIWTSLSLVVWMRFF
ncbi:LOW QUALITY PROTEIN: hypothetical protein U9M48_002865 [Paspalum notatum var. saurae]|uniref:Integrase catalytic domain-containing protein n=1 Tax=Paspalum notatum var. saurae TaxID=547442 RepID=A0AAQ3SHS8_PASNO